MGQKCGEQSARASAARFQQCPEGFMPLSTTTSVLLNIASEDSQSIPFRPGLPGVVNLHAIPSKENPHTETGLLAMVTLHRPGLATPVAKATYKLNTQTLLLSHTVTAAELAASGNWSFTIGNESLETITFATDITFPTNDLLPSSATIDLAFLNLVLAKLADAASIQVHLQTSGDGSPASIVSLSNDMADFLSLPAFTRFNIPDGTKYHIGFRLLGLDSDPEYPVVVFQPSPL